MMVASRSDIKRRRRDSSPLDSNPKRTKVHAQRKFAQGVSSLSNLLNLTPVKEKDKLRNNGLGGNQVNGMNGNENAEGQSDVAIVGKRALPARGAKKPSIDDMITFLCYRGTSALPSHLAHLNKAPSPEPASQSQSGSSESRSKSGDKGRERDKGNKKPLKSSASSAQKAVNAAQALKRKYQEQRIKKTSVSTISSKVKSTPLLRTTRSSAGAISKLSTRNVSNKALEKKSDNTTPSKKKDSSSKDEAARKSSVKTPVDKSSGGRSSTTVTPSGSRSGLRSSGIVSEGVLRSSLRKLGSNVSIKKKKTVGTSSGEDSRQTKKLATSLSDFSSEDDQPLVKKPKPLIQVQKLIKKSIANIGRKMKMEPRRSKRGMSIIPSPTSSSSSKRTSSASKEQTPSTSISYLKEDDLKVKSGKKASGSKELNGLVFRSSSQDSLKKDLTSPKSTPVKMKKGYVMDLVHDSAEEDDVPVEARTRRGSRDLRDAADEKILTNQGTPETSKKQGSSNKKKDVSKSTNQGKTLLGVDPNSDVMSSKSSSSVKNQVELSLSAVLKSPPDLRIPPSIKRPLTAVGITNPMAIAAAAAVVVHKTSTEKVKSKETSQPEDVKLPTSQSNLKSKSLKDEGKAGTALSKPKQSYDNKTLEKDHKPERTKTLSSTRKKDDTSEEDSPPATIKDMKKSKVKTELLDSSKDNVQLESPKPVRSSRKSLVKEPLDDEETTTHPTKTVKSKVKDNDKSILSSRARRSNNRTSKKVLNSDEEDSVEHAITQTQNVESTKIPLSSKKLVPGNESQFDTSSKKCGTIQGNNQSSESEVTKQSSKQEESSENVESDSNSSDYSSAPVAKPSTRSSARNKVSVSRSARSTRSGKKDSLGAESGGMKSKVKQKLDSYNLSSENESDSEQTSSSKAPKTRPRTARSLPKEALSESTDEEDEKKSVVQQGRPARRSATATRSLKSRLRSSSSESASSQGVDEDEDYCNDKVKKRHQADKSSKPSKVKHVRDSRSLKGKVISDEDSDEDIKKTDDKRRNSRGKVADDNRRRSQSPRRSSRRGVKTHDKKSDLSENSSSESSPSPNRRVLRERRFFSFAEVDPLSDSDDEEVIAATKASLEMISQQKSPEPAEPASPAEPNKHRNSSTALSQDSDDDQSKSSEPIKGGKKSNTDPVQPKKSLSKKRVKPPSEVQPNLNEELEKTLMSINLSPQMSKVLERSPDRSLATVSEDLPRIQSPNVSVSCAPPSTTVSVVSEGPSPPITTTSKPLKVVPKVATVTTLASSTSEKTTDVLPPGLQTTPAPQISTVQSISSLPSTLNALAKRNLILKQAAASTSQISVSNSASLVRMNMVPATMVPSSVVTSRMVPSSMVSTNMMSTSMISTNMMPTGMVPTSLVPLSMVSSSAVPSSTVMSVVSSGQATATTFSASAPLVAPMSVASALSQCPPMSSAISGPIALPMSTGMPVSMPISINNQLGISMQTAGGVGVPLSVPMSGAMTLPLQVGPLPSGSSGAAPFLLPVQSTIAPMLAPGQAIIKKEGGALGGMPNPVGAGSPLVVGMNPLVVNSNRTFFLSTGSTMTMTSNQQQMMPGPLMPSLLSLRLPDKPAGQQTIVASSPVYVPLFGNAGLIQTQGQVQPQIQTVAGMSTITAMTSNIQNPVTNPVTANIQNTGASNIQSTVTSNIQHALSANIQGAVAPHVQNVVATNMQNSTGVNVQSASSISSAMALAQNQSSVGGTGMKRQLVLATTKGPVSKLILSVGEDGSHVLAAASPNTATTSEGIMSVMQPSQSMKHPLPVVAQAKPACTIAPKISPVSSQAVQSLPSSTTVPPVVKQPTGQCSSMPVSSPGQVPVSSTMAGTRALPVTSTCVSSSTTVQVSKSGVTNVTSTGLSSTTIARPLSSFSTVPTMASKPCVTQSFPVSSSTARSGGAWSSSSSSPSSGGVNTHMVAASNLGRGDASAHVKPEIRQSNASTLARTTIPSVLIASTHPLQTSYPSISISAMAKMVTSASVVASSSRSAVSKPMLPATVVSSPTSLSPIKVSVTASPVKITLSDVKTPTSTPVLTSRIPSAPAALAALKSPSGTPTSSRAVAKTSSSRKSYSTAASYAAVKTTDTAAPVVIASSAVPSTSSDSTALASGRMASVKPSAAGLKASSSPQQNKGATVPPVVGNLETKRKGSEVELASTHRTLSMLSTAFAGIGKDRKRDIAIKKPTAVSETSAAVEKTSKQLVAERSGLDSLAEIASTLAERSGETSAGDKRAPEHSLWANPAQILGRETLRVPGLPITANVGTNLPTKNELAKMKSGAVLADAVEKKSPYEAEKLPKGKVNSSSSEKSSVAGLLTSSKADTPRQKVQKWLDDGSKADLEHKRNCGLLSNGNSCTCDVMTEDISNLTSLADICVSMERIDSPVKDTNTVKQGHKVTIDRRKKQDPVEPIKNSPQNSPAKPSPPLDSHQRKVAWQTAFGVKSPSRNAKHGCVVQAKQTGLGDEQKKNQVPFCESSDKIKQVTSDVFGENPQDASDTNLDKTRTKKGEPDAVGSIQEEKKLAQKRSLLGRSAESSQAKLDSSAFSADNESSVYAFEAETDTLPISKPFRRRSKTLSRSDEEDSASIGSTSNPVAVQVSKDPVFIPIQGEPDGSSAPLPELRLNKSKIRSPSPEQDNSDVYYIPIGGQEGNEGDARAVAVRLGKEGPNNRVVMSAKLVKKPPTFKHPNDSNEDGFPNKRTKAEVSPLSLTAVQSVPSQQLSEPEKTNVQSHLEVKSNSQGSLLDSKTKQSKKEPSRSSALDSSSEDTSSLSHIPSSSKDFKESRSSMSPTSSRNRSPMSDKTSPSSNSKKKNQGRKRQSSIDSDASDKAQSRRAPKSKSSRMSPSPSLPSTSSTSSGPTRPSQKSNRSYNGPVPGNVSEAPVFHPTEKEFQDPYAYIEKIRPIAEKYGLCRIVAPRSFKPDCNVEDDIRFTADNQYVHKMMDRWGPNAKEMRAIVKYIAQHNIHLKHPPLVGGMELDLPRLYTTVQNFGGLMDVMDKKRWTKVAETMRIPKSAQDRASKLDEVYCKCLLPYETLKTSERDNLFEMVEVEWEMRKERRDKRLAATAIQSESPGAAGLSETQTTSGGSQISSSTGSSVRPIAQEEEEDEDEEEDEEDEEDECIVKGRSMPLTTFYRTARNTIHMWFKGSAPSATEVEHEFWRHVRDRNFHICVNSGSVDCSDPPYGFPIKNSPFAKHPWNLKVLSNSNGSILRSLGSVIGVTVPTLHFGMVFTTCCWYRDPHNLPWIEYLHTGAKKIWYGIPEHGGEKFRTAMQDVAPHYVRKKALWLASDTAMIPPNMLTERKVPLCRTVQEPGQFIVVFPRAHTSSVATGYIVSESVSFAPPSWIPTAVDSFKEMQNCNEPPLFSLDKLVFSIVEDQRTSPNVLNLILPAVMEILDREISGLRELKKMGVSTERIERSKKKLSGKKAKPLKEVEEVEVMECDVCSTNLYLSMLVNTEDDIGYCVPHGILSLEQKKISASQCKLLHMYSQNELHGFCQTLLDRIEAKSGKKGSNFSSNNSDSGSCASTSTRN